MKLLSLVFFLLFSSAFNSTALQFDNNLDYLFDLSLEELLKVKVTGSTLTPKELRTVPSAVTVFTHGEIQNLGLDTLDELMNLVPGFQSYRSSQSSVNYQYSSRGRRIGSSGAEILILVDGTRLAEPRSSGSIIIAPQYPLMQIERVEFIRGPGSAVYGSNAMMGVINIITRSDVNEASASYGSLNRRKGHLLTSKQIRDFTLDLFTYMEMDDGEEYQVQDTFSSNRIGTDDPLELAGFIVKLQWKKTQLNLQHNQFKGENFYELDGISNDYNQRKGRLTAISLKQDLEWQSIASHIWLGYTQSSFTTSPQLTAPGDLAAISSPVSNDALFISVDFDDYAETRMLWHNDWGINSQSSFQCGLEIRRIDAPEAVAKNNFDLGDLAGGNIPIRYYGSLSVTTPVQAESRRDIVGVYGQYQHRLFNSTHLTLGVRHDDFSNIGSQLSPRFALVQELNEHHSLKLLYGEAFRAPAENETNLVNNPVILGNSDLEPETVQSSELIWVGQWSDTGISLGYFEIHFKDAIVQVSLENTRVYENISQDPSKGFELELSHEVNESWLFRGSYTNMIETPELSFREADQLASLMVNYKHSNWNANLFATYHGQQDIPARDSSGHRITLGDYWLLFAKVQFGFSSDWQGFVQVKNILDKDYLGPPVSTGLTDGVPSRGREILAGVVWHF